MVILCLVSRWLKSLIAVTPNLSLVMTPLALLPLLLGEEVSSESKCIYLVLLMAVFWSLNPIPLTITSLLPVVLLPLLGLASTETASGAYLRANNMLFLGCLTLALAIEKSNLHQRIALKVLLKVQTEFSLILLCFMMTTMFFSMWIVSTATVAMMLPIADEIFNNLFCSFDEPTQERQEIPLTPVPKMIGQKGNKQSVQMWPDVQPIKLLAYHEADKSANGNCRLTIEQSKRGPLNEKDKKRVCKLFYLCIAYSATIGGVSTLTANGPNLIMKDILENYYENRDPVDYASWLIFAAPASLVMCLVLWFIFSRLYFRNVSISHHRQQILRQHIEKKYERLGSITFHEWAVLFVFLVMILLYSFYKPQFFPGWSVLFDNKSNATLKPASAAIFTVILLFLIPSKPKWNPNLRNEALLDWHTIQTKLEWGVLLIRGGGFAMADAVQSSGLSKMVGGQLSQLGSVLPVPALIAAISVVASFVIEFMRTSATASILYPVAIKLSEGLGINPLKIVIPCATACAYAFLSPVGTTCNTLIFYHGNLSITDMIVPGLIAKAVSMTIMMLNIHLLGNTMFEVDNPYPEWLDHVHLLPTESYLEEHSATMLNLVNTTQV